MAAQARQAGAAEKLPAEVPARGCQFAQIIGQKDIDGKSRKDMLPRLMCFLLEKPTERLKVDIEAAANVSEQQRKQGFSVLADKLLPKP